MIGLASRGVADPFGTLTDERRSLLTRARQAGPIPALSVCTGAALVLIGISYNAARDAQTSAPQLFWAGLIALVLPLALVLTRTESERCDRLWAILLLALGTYGIKVLYSPTLFNFPDELQHWRTLTDVVQTGRLFTFNPILQVSPLYPGLEIVTSTLSLVTGLPQFAAALIVVGCARVLSLFGLFLFYEAVGGSARIGAIATLVYAANPNFVYFDGQFGYESLALGLAAFVLYALIRRRTIVGRTRLAWTAAAIVGVLALALTHHFTSYVLTALIGSWAILALLVAVVRRSRVHLSDGLHVGAVGVISGAAAFAWLKVIAGPVVEYLAPNFTVGFVELAQLIAGGGTGRVPFRDGSGVQAPAGEQVVGYCSVALILLVLPFGVWAVWRHHRREVAVVPLVLLAVAYPLSLPLRLTAAGVATAGRLPEFLYLGLAFVVACAVCNLCAVRFSEPIRRGLVAGAALVLSLGGVFVGWGPPGRLPGGYLISADARSVDPQALAAAEWTRQALGPGRAMAADRNGALLMGSYGEQQIVSVSNAREDVSPIFFAPTLGPYQREVLTSVGVQFVMIDFRLSGGLPVSGVYYEFQEPDGFQHRSPIEDSALRKFEGVPDVSRVFDAGDIAIYDLTQVIHAR